MFCCLSSRVMANVTVTGERQSDILRFALCTHMSSAEGFWQLKDEESRAACRWARDAPALVLLRESRHPAPRQGWAAPSRWGAFLQPEHKAAVLAGSRTKDVFLASRFLPLALGKSFLVCQLLWGLLADICALLSSESEPQSRAVTALGSAGWTPGSSVPGIELSAPFIGLLCW